MVLIPLVLAVVGCTNPWPLFGLIAIALVLSLREVSLMLTERIQVGAFFPLIFVISLLARGLSLDDQDRFALLVVYSSATLVGIGMVLFGLRSQCRHVLASFGLGGFGLFVTASLLGIIAFSSHWATTDWNWHLPNALLLLLLPVWAGDIAAMLGGKAFGKHFMAPTISPKKTWEGAICNFAASVLTGWGVGAWLGYDAWVGPACGAAVGIFGQLGDLFESALKRAAGKKDSGTLLPGHGGLLDRIDALLGSVIPVWLILHFSGSLG